MANFGWSAGDVAMAVRVVLQVAEAFDNARGAKMKYSASRAFLRGLVPVLERIQLCLEQPEQDEFRKDIMVQGRIIWDAYASFDGYLNKRIGLSSTGQSRLRLIRDTVLSALDEMQGKVQELQSNVVNAMAFIGPVLAFEIKIKVEEISRGLGKSSANNDTYQLEVTGMLKAIQDQTQSLQSLSSDYQTQLAKGMEESRHSTEEEMSAIHKNIELIQKSQEQLVESLKLLTQQIDKQCRQSTSATEAEEWANLRENAEGQSDSLSDLQHTTTQSLDAASKTLGGLSAVVGGNHAFDAASQRVGGLSQAFSAVSGLFGSKKKSSPASDTPVSAARERPSPGPRRSATSDRALPASADYESRTMEGSLPRPRRRSPIERTPIGELPIPPSRTGQRPFDRSKPMPGSSPKETLHVPTFTPPPLPPRAMPGSFPMDNDTEDCPPLPPRSKLRPNPPSKSKSLNAIAAPPTAAPILPDASLKPTTAQKPAIEGNKEPAPSPRPKPRRLSTFTPPTTPNATRPGSSSKELHRGSNELQRGYPSPAFLPSSPPWTPPQVPTSPLSSISSDRIRSPRSAAPPAPNRSPSAFDSTAFRSPSRSHNDTSPAPAKTAPHESPETLPFAERLKLAERAPILIAS